MENIYFIGYGNLDLGSFVDLISKYNIKYLIDIRSKPYSRFNPDFSKSYLSKYLKSINIKYIYWGDVLGGIPSTPRIADINGKIDYSMLENNKEYLQAISKLIKNLKIISGFAYCALREFK